MKTTLAIQITAIEKARELIKTIASSVLEPSAKKELDYYLGLDEALKDAGSTLASLHLGGSVPLDAEMVESIERIFGKANERTKLTEDR